MDVRLRGRFLVFTIFSPITKMALWESSIVNGAFYAPQLEAYAHALENPDRGKPFPVSTMGLLVWRLNGIAETADGAHGFGVTQHYLPVERDSKKFQELLVELIDVIEGEFPEAGPECPTCNYLIQREELESR
jgi:hypothetical protein